MASFDILSGRSKPAGGIFVECDDTAFEDSDYKLNIKNSYFINQLKENNVNANYAPYYVQSSAPSSPYHGWLWYDTDDNKLYQYNAYKTDWVEIDWTTAVKATPEWQAGKLRINSGMLQITPNSGTNWYDCYAALGSDSIEPVDLSKKYFPFSSINYIFNNRNIIPIVFSKELSSVFSMIKHGGTTVYLYPSGLAINNGVYSVLYEIDFSPWINRWREVGKDAIVITEQNLVPIYLCISTSLNRFGLHSFSIDLSSTYGGRHFALSFCPLNTLTNAYYIGTLSTNTTIIVRKEQ